MLYFTSLAQPMRKRRKFHCCRHYQYNHFQIGQCIVRFEIKTMTILTTLTSHRYR